MFMALLDDYFFSMDGASYQELNEKITGNWNKIDRLGANPKHQATKGYSEEVSVSGVLILKNVKELDGLRDIVRNKKPVTLVIPGTWEVYSVVVNQLEIKRDVFIGGGVEARKSFSLKMERYYENVL